jgi:hypothetical protein
MTSDAHSNHSLFEQRKKNRVQISVSILKSTRNQWLHHNIDWLVSTANSNNNNNKKHRSLLLYIDRVQFEYFMLLPIEMRCEFRKLSSIHSRKEQSFSYAHTRDEV